VERQLSSDITVVFQIVLPALVLPALAALVFVSFSEGIGASLWALFALAFVSFAFREFIAPLKRVVATQHGLHISGFRVSFQVPYTEIEAVTRVAKRYDIIEVVFRNATPFGRAVKFMAGARFFWWSEHPVVAFLRERAGLAPE
jgi:hypothetical protein